MNGVRRNIYLSALALSVSVAPAANAQSLGELLKRKAEEALRQALTPASDRPATPRPAAQPQAEASPTSSAAAATTPKRVVDEQRPRLNDPNRSGPAEESVGIWTIEFCKPGYRNCQNQSVRLRRNYGVSTETFAQAPEGAFSIRTKQRWMLCASIDPMLNSQYKIHQRRCQIISGNVPLIDYPAPVHATVRAVYPEEIVPSERPFVEIEGAWRCAEPRCTSERAMTDSRSDPASADRARRICAKGEMGEPLWWNRPSQADRGVYTMEVTCLLP